MPKIIIAPLATPNSITMSSHSAIITAAEKGMRLFLQTAAHPFSKWIQASSIEFEVMDDLYEKSQDFDTLAEAIAERLICGKDAVYAVLGRGAGVSVLQAIQNKSAICNTDIIVLPSSGYSEAVSALSGFDMSGATIVCSNDLPIEINVRLPLCVEDIDTKLRACEVKTHLSEFYPDETDVIFASIDGLSYDVRSIKLFELDRQTEYHAGTVLLIRPHSLFELNRHGLDGLIEVMQRLRAPDGCPWDRKQTHESLKNSLIEETYEVMDAITAQDTDSLLEELGDLLLQIVFHAQIEAEHSRFNMRDVCTGIINKLVYRHPHVFSHSAHIETADEVITAWEKLKKIEKQQVTQTDAMNSIPKTFPALLRSLKIQKKAADVGFDWNNPYDALAKVEEEAVELRDAAKSGVPKSIHEEMGDLLFSVVNVSRHFKVNPEIALSAAADKFISRFAAMEERILQDGKDIQNMSLKALDDYWEMVKKQPQHDF